MRRKLGDFLVKRRHCPFKVRARKLMEKPRRIRSTVLSSVLFRPRAPLQANELAVTVWQCTAAGCAL